MKYNYCPKCRKAFVKSRLEKGNCIYCNGDTEQVDVGRNGLYYLGYGIMMAGAMCVLLPRFVELEGSNFYVAMGIAMAVGGSVLVVMGSTKMAKDAVNSIRDKVKSESKE